MFSFPLWTDKNAPLRVNAKKSKGLPNYSIFSLVLDIVNKNKSKRSQIPNNCWQVQVQVRHFVGNVLSICYSFHFFPFSLLYFIAIILDTPSLWLIRPWVKVCVVDLHCHLLCLHNWKNRDNVNKLFLLTSIPSYFKIINFSTLKTIDDNTCVA